VQKADRESLPRVSVQLPTEKSDWDFHQSAGASPLEGKANSRRAKRADRGFARRGRETRLPSGYANAEFLGKIRRYALPMRREFAVSEAAQTR
jgi:hypothetical protein